LKNVDRRPHLHRYIVYHSVMRHSTRRLTGVRDIEA
jgi:hypothetical protein